MIDFVSVKQTNQKVTFKDFTHTFEGDMRKELKNAASVNKHP
jgi:hypothetical protein